jgi:CHAT domain
MHTLEITIQRKPEQPRNKDKPAPGWPVVVEYGRPGIFLPIRREGLLELDRDGLNNQQVQPREYGTVLGKALFRDKVRDTFVTARGRAREDRLRLLLFVEADELKTLRWERLCAPLDGVWDFVALDQSVPFSLYLPSNTDRHFPPIGRRDLRALVLAASPEGLGYGLDPFNVTAVVSGVRGALGKIPCDVLAMAEGSVGLPTLDCLCAQITEGDYTLLHVVCHGRFQPQAGDTVLYLATPGNGVHGVPAKAFVTRLRGLRGARGLPHFAFLCSCESASPQAEETVGGLAQQMVRDLGMPAVVAMTDRISMATAQALAEGFYRRLGEHGEADRALAEAFAPLAGRHDVNVPVLYSRLGGRPLFSDTLDRPLNRKEIDSGLDRLKGLLRERAPVLLRRFDREVAGIQEARVAGLGSPGTGDGDESEGKLDVINRWCGEVLGMSFRALALGHHEPPAYDARCPFRGLYPFRRKDRRFFFGREELVRRLARRLRESGFLAVLGKSGSGKSSVVRAGLIPALRKQKPGLRTAYLRPGSDPPARLEAKLQKVQGHPFVLVVDQFEELFTLCPEEGKRWAFLDRLLGLGPAGRVVLAMRADFLGECAPYGDLAKAVREHLDLIPPMDTAELRRAMERQAAQVGLRFEADLSNTILDEVRGEPGAMPLLQHALRELWKRRHGPWLRASEYRKIGGVRRAVARTADAFFKRLPGADQDRMRDIFTRLTRLGEDLSRGEERRETRRRVAIEELVAAGSDPALTTRLVNRLADRRLVVTSRDSLTGQKEVEVAHEALLRHWPMLAKWVDKDRGHLRAREEVSRAAREWEENAADESYLMRGKRLEEALFLIDHPRLTLNARERAYLDACVGLHERDKERARKEEQRRPRPTEMEIRISPSAGAGKAYPVEMRVSGRGDILEGNLYLGSVLYLAVADPQVYGRALGEALFQGTALGDAFNQALAALPAPDGKLRVRLRLEAPELHAVYWEHLSYPLGGEWHPLGFGTNTPFSRDVPGPWQEALAPPAGRPLRLLAVVASPTDLERYKLNPISEEERQALRKALAQLPDVAVTYLESGGKDRPTLDRVVAAFGEGFHLVHFLCRAATTVGRGGAALFLEQPSGSVDVVGSERLRDSFSRSRTRPWVCFLGEGTADTRLHNPAPLLLGRILVEYAGIPAAVVMTERVGPETAGRFARAFYGGLLTHGAIDVAANEARALVQDGWHWGVPVLYSLLSDNQIPGF